MPNSRDINTGNSNVLVIGDTGSWKTRFLSSVPGIFNFDFDKGMASAREFGVEYATFKDGPRGLKLATGEIATMSLSEAQQKEGLYEWGTAWDHFWKKVIDINERFNRGEGPKAVGLDSLTFMSDMAINKILRDTKHENPHQGTWGAHHGYFKTVFSVMTMWPCRFIATAHIRRTENDLTGISEKLPLLAGQMSGLISAFFDEVYFTELNTDASIKLPGTERISPYVLRTVADGSMRQAKTRWNVPDRIPPVWSAVEKHLPAITRTVRATGTPTTPSHKGAEKEPKS